MVGIWGMGGIGKTTIARAVYHQISYEFEGSSFVEDVRENGSAKKGLKSLQEKLLSEILMDDRFKVKDCNDGISQIRRRLGRKKVLIVLDDVDSIKQLEFLAGAHDWFGPGSRIMITTRDEHLLNDAQDKYVPELLDETEATKLFNRFAFKANINPKEYVDLSTTVVSHTGRLPLALKVLGSHFCGRNLDFWQSALNVLAKVPHKEINGILKLSFDGLNILEQKIFLDVACFFKGRERRKMTRVLDSFGFEAESGITVLIEKSLLTISKGNLHMHDLIQDMGRSIVQEYYPINMVWALEEIKEVMMKNIRSETVEAIVDTSNYHFLEMPMACCNAEVFKIMNKLRLLEVKAQFTLNVPTYFPEELNWLCWSDYTFESLNITRGMTKLVGLEMPFGRMKQFQIQEKAILANLKFMDLRSSSSLKSFPDISGVPYLESLNLSRCNSLVEVHESVLHHERIIHLDLSSCKSLKILPSTIQMKSLLTLHFYDCESLERFPEVSMEMGSLSVINIDGCEKIRALPLSIALFTALTILIVGRCSDMELEPVALPPCLEELDLHRNLITRVPASISRISHLKCLDLRYCSNLKELHELPSLIQVLKADHCTSLEKIGDFSNKCKWLSKISLRGCHKLLNDQGSKNLLANLLKKSLVQKYAAVNHGLSVAVPGSKIPNWFNNQRSGETIALNLPKNKITEMRGLAVCCVLRSPMIEMSSYLEIKLKPLGEEKLIDSQAAHAAKSADLVWNIYMSIDRLQNLCHGFKSEDLIISFGSDFDDFVMVGCGVCVIYKDDIRLMSETGSWIPDYNEPRRIDHDSAYSEDLQYGRSSKPTFSFDNETTRDHKTIKVRF